MYLFVCLYGTCGQFLLVCHFLLLFVVVVVQPQLTYSVAFL